MPRPSGDQPPIRRPINPDHIRLYVDRKGRGNGVIEAQSKMPDGWSGYRVMGREMPAAERGRPADRGSRPIPACIRTQTSID
jgi:hypothetical protein